MVRTSFLDKACLDFTSFVLYAIFEKYSQVITCSNSSLIEQAELAGIIWVLLMWTCCIFTHLRSKPW